MSVGGRRVPLRHRNSKQTLRVITCVSTCVSPVSSLRCNSPTRSVQSVSVTYTLDEIHRPTQDHTSTIHPNPSEVPLSLKVPFFLYNYASVLHSSSSPVFQIISDVFPLVCPINLASQTRSLLVSPPCVFPVVEEPPLSIPVSLLSTLGVFTSKSFSYSNFPSDLLY